MSNKDCPIVDFRMPKVQRPMSKVIMGDEVSTGSGSDRVSQMSKVQRPMSKVIMGGEVSTGSGSDRVDREFTAALQIERNKPVKARRELEESSRLVFTIH